MPMKLQHLSILWIDRLAILKTRKLSWLLTITCFTTACLVIFALVNKHNVQVLLYFLVPYFSVGLTCFLLLKMQKNKPLSRLNSYALTILLYQIYDQVSMILVSYSFWAIGLRLMSLSLDADNRVIQVMTLTLNLLLIIMIALSIIFSQKLIRQKTEALLANKVITTLPSWLLKFLIMIPVAGAIIGSFAFRGDHQTVGLVIITILSLLFGFFMLPLITSAFCETIILASNKWPVIRKVGSEYKMDDV
jgi:thiamine transporter ThiT